MVITVEQPARQPGADGQTPALTRRWPPGATVNLDGTGSSDPDAGDTLDYSWTQTGGTAVTLTGADTATPTFTAPTAGTRLTLTSSSRSATRSRCATPTRW